jgi:hypothetical protein
MKNLNLLQKRILLAGVGIIVLMGLVPPWTWEGYNQQPSGGYHFLLDPSPFNYSSNTHLNIGILFMQWFLVALVTVALMFYFKDWKPKE